MRAGLRIDVDTFRGTRSGVPNLLRLLADHGIHATFFFCVGPDNMGRHLWRLLRPRFLWKMLRTRAASLYGWDILLRGTLWPGPSIGKHLGSIIHDADVAGHEVGLHAWDHQRWQAALDSMDRETIASEIRKGFDELSRIIGHEPSCSATPSWKCNDAVLAEKATFPFHYNSDCRGTSIFDPVVSGRVLKQPQVPVTLPTYDEVVGAAGISPQDYNDHLLSLFVPDGLNVLTIHAEVEGIACLGLFEDFLNKARASHWDFVPLGDLVHGADEIPSATIVPVTLPGRDGWIASQAGEIASPATR